MKVVDALREPTQITSRGFEAYLAEPKHSSVERERSTMSRFYPKSAVWLIITVGTHSCFELATPVCSNGLRCPVGSFCSADEPPICIGFTCGDGVLDSQEVCDDGNALEGDGCSADCSSNGACGNGIVDFVVGERCDDGNALGHDGCSSQCQLEPWQWQESGNQVRSPRLGHAMTYDAARGMVVLFGGDDDLRNDETWEWDGSDWTLKIPAIKPSRRSSHAMAYDASRSRVTLFGGGSHDGTRNDETWEWDGTDWIRRIPSTKPSARASHAMAYNAASDRIILFGGSDSSRSNETWEWDGNDWTLKTPATKPSPRSLLAMVYDAARGRVCPSGEPA